MPYTNEQLNAYVGKEVDALIQKVRSGVSPQDVDGVANHIITRIVLGLLHPNTGWNYKSLSNVIKTLECSKLEIERRVLGPYEDLAICRNGDIPEITEALKEISDRTAALK